jgi:sarcosine oxidase subunit beta
MMVNQNRNPYDVIIIGAGSIGTPTAYYLGASGLKTLVIDAKASVGQGSSKHAIGGIRATHSDPAKISLCQRSIQVFSSWKDVFGDDIEWYQGGYCFVAYHEDEMYSLKSLLVEQKALNLNIEWYESSELLDIVPDLNPEGLFGGTFSPADGNASPLLAIHAYYQHAKEKNVDFIFNETVRKILTTSNRVIGVETNRSAYYSDNVIIAAGAWSNDLGKSVNLNIPMTPDSHEAAITEPVARFLDPMIVDIHPTPGSSNFYYYQHYTGQIVFCITPSPNIWGFDIRETSSFLPMISKRLVNIMPRLINLRVRRTWRGLYPMTPDGFPIIGRMKEFQGLILATGMCGQGFMLGPGVGELMVRIISGNLTESDQVILKYTSPYREFIGQELLK